MSLYNYLHKQKMWSLETFGPGDSIAKAEGLVDHIRKELVEILEDPTDTTEWLDVVILAFEGALRSTSSIAAVQLALEKKMDVNIKREWPDWRDVPEGQAIEHIKEDV